LRLPTISFGLAGVVAVFSALPPANAQAPDPTSEQLHFVSQGGPKYEQSAEGIEMSQVRAD
jgi:hypothetical protein